ncbi:MAG: histidine triad nucleotide-binding protein [Candidatus Wildermuthbacteria bacterium RIFCSPLOWO2_01_FULL_48_29]|uniref:Histidine triad nucleotide-binding protein n=2 Tax=Candidatus Wildermuthiibacteriota TaxID=1817923 RepID=A0A1G2RL32_9BACT|nr:MAG: histidine triad nucleotide-binding protein [Candidatus Wildermuthbacteria bacterium RIFCSPHIGHO2_01_FULL_48_27b]OHA73546.1 MAG: histidine triad nucleotide-binding protein [Candidatus Wildermuthbacteria bacterium RIFCSPLOWO2_01_FULL_48_29]
MEDCIFCKIAAKEAPAKIVYEDEQFIVFPDINPKAPFHVLLMPKKHIKSLQEVAEGDTELMGRLIITAQKVAQGNHLKGYKLAMHVGKEGGQEVDHLHLHLLAG